MSDDEDFLQTLVTDIEWVVTEDGKVELTVHMINSDGTNKVAKKMVCLGAMPVDAFYMLARMCFDHSENEREKKFD